MHFSLIPFPLLPFSSLVEDSQIPNFTTVDHSLPNSNPIGKCSWQKNPNMSAIPETPCNGSAFLSNENGSLVSCRCFSLDEVLRGTNNFDDALVIGVGGFGKVYKGFIGTDSSEIVAVKRLNTESKQGAGEFWTEIKTLSKLRHRYLVSLIGYCNELSEMILVYEYMSRGTLANHLYKLSTTGSGKSSISHLTWEQRLNICIGTARGLDYLHTGTNQSFIHRDVKTTNILLDDNWVAKISDFGLSKGTASYSITHVSTDVKGTFGYLDPEYYLTQRLTTKSDVYAFGVILLEVLCGRPSVDKTLVEEQISLVQWAQHCFKKGKLEAVIDHSLRGQIASRSLKSFVKLANNCLGKNPKSRPTMGEVLGSLELALGFQQKGGTEGIISKAIQSTRWLRGRKDNGSSTGQSKGRKPERSYSSLKDELDCGLKTTVGPLGEIQQDRFKMIQHHNLLLAVSMTLLLYFYAYLEGLMCGTSYVRNFIYCVFAILVLLGGYFRDVDNFRDVDKIK